MAHVCEEQSSDVVGSVDSKEGVPQGSKYGREDEEITPRDRSPRTVVI